MRFLRQEHDHQMSFMLVDGNRVSWVQFGKKDVLSPTAEKPFWSTVPEAAFWKCRDTQYCVSTLHEEVKLSPELEALLKSLRPPTQAQAA
jgi:hypothetical protein